MRRIALTLFLSIIVFVATIVGTNIYISRKSVQTADQLNTIALDRFKAELNSDIMLTEQSARSFLTGMPSVMLGSDSTTIIIDEKLLSEFKAEVYDCLSEFMKANKYYQNSLFIIDQEICRDYYGIDGFFVPSSEQGDTERYELSGIYDFEKMEHYNKVKTEHRPLWSKPDSTLPIADKYMTLYIPLMLGNGRFFGAFALSLDIEMINNKLKRHLPYDRQSAMFLADEDDNIFAAYPEWILQSGSRDSITTNVYLMEVDYKSVDHQVCYYRGKEYYVYKRDGLLAPWCIYTLTQSEAIYNGANKFISMVFATSFVGMLLMLICCAVIFRQIKKNLQLKAAAEEELKMAATVQTSMLKPTTYSYTPRLPLDTASPSPLILRAFMQPAKQAGGDLYDYVEKDGKLIFCIGDVSGKGMPAALFMTQVVSLFRNAVMNSSDPTAITSQINDVLAQNNPNMTFCTFFVGVLCGEEIQFCNAGHNPPVLVASETQYLKVRPNLALGLMEGYPYTSESIPFHHGDSLLLYTDGVTEAKGKGGQLYGEDRLLEVLRRDSAQSLDKMVVESVSHFTKGEEQSDDITIVVI